MKLLPDLKKRYAEDIHSAKIAQRLAHEISFGPMVFQVSRLMVKFGILELLRDKRDGLTESEISNNANISLYATKILLEASLSIGTILYSDNKYKLSKVGWFMLTDSTVKVNMDFNHDVNYLGLFKLEESLLEGKPAGLEHFGNWSTIYEGLSSLPSQVQDSWFTFDHFYSDHSFSEALKIVFDDNTKTLLDVGGNTGRWAEQCVNYNKDVEVTIMDLPQQIQLMKERLQHIDGFNRIKSYGANILDRSVKFPSGFDVIWMSQFLDCFSEEEIISILSRAAESMACNSRILIMETFWNRQKYETAAYDLTMTSVYFTALANGNSKMYSDEDMQKCVEKAGLKVEIIYDNLGYGHSIMQCKLNKK